MLCLGSSSAQGIRVMSVTSLVYGLQLFLSTLGLKTAFKLVLVVLAE